MTQADSVHSTPPTNTSATNPPGPVDPTRRHLLTVAAGGAVAALTTASPTIAARAPDPIYAAIETHKDRVKAYDAAWKVRGNFKDFGEMTEDEKAQLRQFNDATDAAHLPLEAAALDLIDTVPTTQAGIIAALRYTRTQCAADGEYMVEGWWAYEDGSERDIDWLDDWLDSLTDAVSALGGADSESATGSGWPPTQDG
jgi:hypothetical protein